MTLHGEPLRGNGKWKRLEGRDTQSPTVGQWGCCPSFSFRICRVELLTSSPAFETLGAATEQDAIMAEFTNLARGANTRPRGEQEHDLLFTTKWSAARNLRHP